MPKATIPIYHDDDFERLAELRLAVSIAERNYDADKDHAADSEPRRVGDDDGAREAKEALQSARDEFDEFVDAAADRAEMWTLKSIGHEAFRDLLAEHPPRKVPGESTPLVGVEGVVVPEMVTHPDDEGWEINTETFGKALLLFVDPDDAEHRTVVAPTFPTEAAFQKRVRRLSKGQFETMWITAHQANEGAVADPKASRFSLAGPRSDET